MALYLNIRSNGTSGGNVTIRTSPEPHSPFGGTYRLKYDPNTRTFISNNGIRLNTRKRKGE